MSPLTETASAPLPPQEGIWYVSDPLMWYILMVQRCVHTKRTTNMWLCVCVCVNPCTLQCIQVLAWLCRASCGVLRAETAITRVVSSSATFLWGSRKDASFEPFFTFSHLRWGPLKGIRKETTIATFFPFQHCSKFSVNTLQIPPRLLVV